MNSNLFLAALSLDTSNYRVALSGVESCQTNKRNDHIA
jgi:hypothetical protein